MKAMLTLGAMLTALTFIPGARAADVGQTIEGFGLAGEWSISCAAISAQIPHVGYTPNGSDKATYTT